MANWRAELSDAERLAQQGIYDLDASGNRIIPKPKGGAFLPSLISAAELQRRVFPPIRWTLPGLVPEGLTLLCGKPKLGKSWLALDIGLAVSRGQFTLGRKCDAGPVLYLALEDSDRRLKARMERIAGNSSWPETFEFATEWPRADQKGLDHIEGWLDRNDGARLVIVDTLATVRPPARATETAHGSDYAALRGFHAIANTRGIAVVVVHHVRKADADDPFDTVSGSTGLTGAADTTLILSRRPSDDGIVLYGRGRDLEEIETAVEFDAETFRWRDMGDPAEAYATDTRAAIFSAIRAGKQTPKTIADFAGLDHELVKKTLQRMRRAGDVRREGRGSYIVPPETPSPASPCPFPEPETGDLGDIGTEGTGFHGEGEALDAFEERAAILEHEAGLSRAEAEAAALAELNHQRKETNQ